MVSSKTLAELSHYQRELGLEHPVVAENGAAIHVPAGYFSASTSIAGVVARRDDIQSAYLGIKETLACQCRAFFELGVDGIMATTGLSQAQAALANDRAGSEPVLWEDSDERLGQFIESIEQAGLRCTRGGRFVHVMGNTDKARAVAELIDAYQAEWPAAKITTVSLGDGPNDLGMLASTDVGVVIPGKHNQPMLLESANRILNPVLHGPAGWNEAMQQLLSEQERSDQLSTGE